MVTAEPRLAGNDMRVEPRDTRLRVGELMVDTRTRRAENAHGSLRLTVRECDLLRYLSAHPGETFTREQLMTAVWGYVFPGDTSTVTVHMRRLRTKVEPDPGRPRHLLTVWGTGYKFEP